MSGERKYWNSKSFDLLSYQGMIFDLDGTLVDSSKAILEVLTGWCAKHQISLTKVLERCHGCRIVDFLPDIAPHLDCEAEARYLATIEANTRSGLVGIAYSKKFIALLHEYNIPWAIATSGTAPVASLRLEVCELPKPTVFVTSELVSNGKPAPDPFLLAAKKLNKTSEKCLAFEDSDSGIKSAIAAGCDVVVIGHESSVHHSKIVARVEDFRKLSLLLLEQLKRKAERSNVIESECKPELIEVTT